MGQLLIHLSEETEKRLRTLIDKKYKGRRGGLSITVEDFIVRGLEREEKQNEDRV
jgi:hypothetical protein